MARIPMHIRTPLAEPEIDPRVSLVQPASLEPGSVLLDALQPKHTTDTGHESAHRRGGGDSDADDDGGADPHEPAIVRRYDQPTHPVLQSVERGGRRGGRGVAGGRRKRVREIHLRSACLCLLYFKLLKYLLKLHHIPSFCR